MQKKTSQRAHAGFFNLTMTYRLDSNIPRPYGWIQARDGQARFPPRKGDKMNWRQYDERAFK